jgi:hypothetical protein
MATKKFRHMKAPWVLGMAGVLFDVVSVIYFFLTGWLVTPRLSLNLFDTVWVHLWKMLNYPGLVATEWAFNLAFDVYNMYTPMRIFFFYYLALCIPMFFVGYALGHIIQYIWVGLEKKSSASWAGLDWKCLAVQLVKCMGILILVLAAIIIVDAVLCFILADELAAKHVELEKLDREIWIEVDPRNKGP